MVLGLLLGAAIPQLDDWLDTVKVGTVSLPIAIGLPTTALSVATPSIPRAGRDRRELRRSRSV